MMFHLGFELPEPVSTELDHTSAELTREEVKILRRQIRKNACLVEQYVNRLDLLVNKERHPGRTVFVHKIRRRLELLMEENDTFRSVLWKYYQTYEMTNQKWIVNRACLPARQGSCNES